MRSIGMVLFGFGKYNVLHLLIYLNRVNVNYSNIKRG